MNKQPEVTAETRKQILEAFWENYQGRRIEKVTVSAVSQKAGIHRSTFYEYFNDVYALLDAWEDDVRLGIG